MIQFETRTERQKQMIEAITATIDELRNRPREDREQEGEKKSAIDQASMMNMFMQSKAAQYMDMIMQPGGLLPFKTDVMRQLIMYGNESPEAGETISQSAARRQLVKYALTAMGMAAISSGKGGREIAMRKYLPEIMKGRLFCYAITEPGAGTNTNKISTRAVEDGDAFRITGQKTFISAADTSYYMVLVAKIVRNGEEQGVGTFIFETATTGVSMSELDIAVLGEKPFTIYLDDVVVPKDALVGSKSATKSTGRISASVFYTLNLERIIVGYISLQIARQALAKAVKMAREVRDEGGLIGRRQDVKQRIARVKLRLELANLATRRATLAYDARDDVAVTGMFANMAKYISTMAANEACDLALSLHGAAGLDKEAEDIGGIYQMARLLRVAPINNEMVINFLGEHMLGMPKSYR